MKEILQIKIKRVCNLISFSSHFLFVCVFFCKILFFYIKVAMCDPVHDVRSIRFANSIWKTFLK